MFTYHEKEDAPENSRGIMEEIEGAFGFVPNLHKILAEAPITLETYSRAFNLFASQSSFSPLEAQIIFMTSNYENNCHYCTAGHSMMMEMMKLPQDIIGALREGKPLVDPKMENLRSFTQELLENRGHVGDERLQSFLSAGYSKKQALEILCALSAKLISNFANALAHTNLDEPMKPFAWTHPEKR